MLKPAEMTWSVRDDKDAGADCPPGRSGHSLTVVGRAAYMFGGVSQPMTKSGGVLTKLDALRQINARALTEDEEYELTLPGAKARAIAEIMAPPPSNDL
jgi:hypothetical protein